MAQISKHLKISDHISPLNDITFFSSFLTFFFIQKQLSMKEELCKTELQSRGLLDRSCDFSSYECQH